MSKTTPVAILAVSTASMLAVLLLVGQRPWRDRQQELPAPDEVHHTVGQAPPSHGLQVSEDTGSDGPVPEELPARPAAPVASRIGANLTGRAKTLLDGILTRSTNLGLGTSYLSLLGQFAGKDEAIEFLGDTTPEDVREACSDPSVPMSIKSVMLQLLGTRFCVSDRDFLFDLLRSSPDSRVKRLAAQSINSEIIGGCVISKSNVDAQVMEQVLSVFLAERDSRTRSELVDMMEVYFEENLGASADRILGAMEHELLFSKDPAVRIAILSGFADRLPDGSNALLNLVLTDSDDQIRRLAAQRLKQCVETENPGEQRRKDIADRVENLIANERDRTVARSLRIVLAVLAGK